MWSEYSSSNSNCFVLGQAIYWDKVRQLTNDISCLEDIQKTFLDDIERHNSKKPKKEWV